MNKREAVLSLLDPSQTPSYTPAAFFLHFDPVYHRGQAAVDKHLEYFRYTEMDFVKIQYENGYPQLNIQKPSDWAKIPRLTLDDFEQPLRVVDGLVKAAKAEAIIVLTLYSPFMLAGIATSEELVTRHINEAPDEIKLGMEIITDNLMRFVKECIRLGLDGFYTSTQGGEVGRLKDRALFDACVRPFDLALMEEINRTTLFNILHVCDYHLPYNDLSPYVDYPGQVVNASLELADGSKISAKEVAKLFGRPFMGGLERKGILATGAPAEVEQATRAALQEAPERFILGADCTVPANTSWDNLRAAIRTAHSFA